MAVVFKRKLKVVVCGGRRFNDRNLLFTELDKLHTAYWIDQIINGGSGGADKLAREWARRNHVALATYPAEWDRYGRRAGPIRNQQMLDEEKPDVVLAFPGGDGTADMVRRARSVGVCLIEIKEQSYADYILR
jgi:hypothetical protein